MELQSHDPRVSRILDAAVQYLDAMLKRQEAETAHPAPSPVIASHVPRSYPLCDLAQIVACPDGAIVAMLEDGRTFALRAGMTEWVELARLPIPMSELR